MGRTVGRRVLPLQESIGGRTRVARAVVSEKKQCYGRGGAYTLPVGAL